MARIRKGAIGKVEHARGRLGRITEQAQGDEAAHHDPQLDIDDIIPRPPSIRESGSIAADDAEPVLRLRRLWQD